MLVQDAGHVLVQHVHANSRARSIWQVLPAYTVKGMWVMKKTLITSGQATYTYQTSWGYENKRAWTKTTEYTSTVTQVASADVEVVGCKGSVCGTASASYEVTDEQKQYGRR